MAKESRVKVSYGKSCPTTILSLIACLCHFIPVITVDPVGLACKIGKIMNNLITCNIFLSVGSTVDLEEQVYRVSHPN